MRLTRLVSGAIMAKAVLGQGHFPTGSAPLRPEPGHLVCRQKWAGFSRRQVGCVRLE